MSETSADEPKRDRSRSTGIADGLRAADILRAIDEWRLNGRDSFLRTFGGTQAQKYVVIDGNDEFDALALLRGARHLAGLRVNAGYRGDRRNVADPLRRLGFFVENLDSETGSPVSAEPSDIQRWIRTFSGPTDQWSVRQARREQAILSGALGIGTGDASRLHARGLCERGVPEILIVAAHIKPRQMCSEAERLDIPHIAIPACLLGCDALFEQGFITVDHNGDVLAADESPVDLSYLAGIRFKYWSPGREKYFAWHRVHRFRGASRASRVPRCIECGAIRIPGTP